MITEEDQRKTLADIADIKNMLSSLTQSEGATWGMIKELLHHRTLELETKLEQVKADHARSDSIDALLKMGHEIAPLLMDFLGMNRPRSPLNRGVPNRGATVSAGNREPPKPCDKCSGSGKIVDSFDSLVTCPKCNGSGVPQ